MPNTTTNDDAAMLTVTLSRSPAGFAARVAITHPGPFGAISWVSVGTWGPYASSADLVVDLARALRAGNDDVRDAVLLQIQQPVLQ